MSSSSFTWGSGGVGGGVGCFGGVLARGGDFFFRTTTVSLTTLTGDSGGVYKPAIGDHSRCGGGFFTGEGVSTCAQINQ